MAENPNLNTQLETLNTLVDVLINAKATNEVKNSLGNMNGLLNYQNGSFNKNVLSPFNTPIDLLTNNPVALDYLQTQNGMVKKAIDIRVESAFKMPPKLSTTMINEEDCQKLQNIFNEFFNEYKNASKQTLLYGGVFLVLSFGKTPEELLNFNKKLSELQEGDTIQVNAFNPWQILDIKQYNVGYVNQVNIANIDKQHSAFIDFVQTQKKNAKRVAKNIKEQEDNNVISLGKTRYSFTSFAGALSGDIDQSLIMIMTNDAFTPYYTGIRLINRWSGFSILESVDEDLRRYEEALRVMTEIQKVPLIRQIQIPDLASMMMNNASASKVEEAIKKVSNAITQHGFMPTDKDVAINQIQTSFAGLIEIIQFLKNAFIEKIGIPLNIWNGEGASGLNATGEDVDRQWTEKLVIEQNKSKVILHKIAVLLAKAIFGIELTDLKMEYNNNYNETEQTKQAKKDAIIKNLGDLQTIVQGKLSTKKIVQIVNNANIFGEDIEVDNIEEGANQTNDQANFLNLANDKTI